MDRSTATSAAPATAGDEQMTADERRILDELQAEIRAAMVRAQARLDELARRQPPRS